MKTNKQILFFLFTLLTIRLTAQQSNFDFVENKGQWNSQVKFMGDVGTGAFYLEKTGFTVLLNSPEDLKKLHDKVHGGGNASANGNAGSTLR